MKTNRTIADSRADAIPAHQWIDNPRRYSCRHPHSGAPTAPFFVANNRNRLANSRLPFDSIKVGAWTGGAFTNDTTGAFSHCGAGAPYSSGIYFMVLVDANLDWALGFANENWSVKKDQVFQIALTFDGQTPFNVYGVAVSEKLVRVSMPTNSSLIAQFRKAKSMTAFTQGQLFQFKLDQTAQLLPTLANCAAKMKENGVASAG